MKTNMRDCCSVHNHVSLYLHLVSIMYTSCFIIALQISVFRVTCGR